MGLEFSGAGGNRVEFGTNSVFDSGTGDLTIMAWANTTQTTPGSVVAKGANSSGQMRYKIEFDGGSPNQVKFEIDDNTTKKSAFTTSGPNDGEWHHFVGVRDNTANLIRIYVDAIEEATVDITGYGNIDSSQSALIGAMHNGSGGFHENFDGMIDDVRYYIGRALTPAEIEAIYRSRGHDGIVDSLVARYLLNEQPPGTTVVTAGDIVDAGPNGLNGLVVSGSPSWIASELSFRRLVRV